MKPELKAQWVSALRSGEYQQCTGTLHMGDGYCCFGVLQKLAGRDLTSTSIGYIGSDHYDIDDDYRIKLENMNDGVNDHRKHTFAEIADFIEKNI